MSILKIIILILLVLCLSLYAFWQKLLKGKAGRISGEEVEKQKYADYLVVDVRWRKEYAKSHAQNAINVPIKMLKEGHKILDDYKDKNIILYCTVDVTSRNAEKILRTKGFKNLFIGDGVKQYNYNNMLFKNALMQEFKYLVKATQNAVLLNVGTEELDYLELKISPELIEENIEQIPSDKIIFVYSNNEDDALEVSKCLTKYNRSVVNLIEPMNKAKYLATKFNAEDYKEAADIQLSSCG